MEEVKECSNFEAGECGFSDKYCWNLHTNKHMQEHDEQLAEEQDFHKSTDELVPPENGN